MLSAVVTKLILFTIIYLVILPRTSIGLPLLNVDFCMAEYGACNSKSFAVFSQIYCQFGCAERCSQFENCNW